MCIKTAALMLAVAAVHPKGENVDYDGLYFRDAEMDDLARGMRGIPLLVEHDGNPVGKVLHAFKNPSDRRLYAVFETNTDTFGGCVAGRLVHHGLAGEVSLGHECKIESSADGTQRVVGKIPTELSIVEKGAREETKIYAKTRITPAKRYIKVSAVASDAPRRMTDVNAPQIPVSVSEQSSPEMVRQLLEQVKALTEKQTKLDQENSQLKDANSKFAVQVEKTEAAGKRKREVAIDGSIKDWMKTLLDKYNTELQPHEAELDGMFEGMKNNAEAEPMIQALACAAAAAKGSVTELEAQYQANKKLKTEIDELRSKMVEESKPMFANKTERVKTIEAQASATTSAPAQPKSFNSIFSSSRRTPATLRGAGMRETNPELWADLMASAPTDRGMPKIDAFMNMVRK
tara:strand:+ start:10927 stop:12135 length:1209 start_codon:yes stop_codon:yes gene_type:complete